eukprot:g1952.t1
MADLVGERVSLPDERRLWQFLERAKGWRFIGTGKMVCGPDVGNPMESDELPQYVAARPSLMAEYRKWDQGRQPQPGKPKEQGGGKRDAAPGEGKEGKAIPASQARQPLEEADVPASSMETEQNPPSSTHPSLAAPAPPDSGGASESIDGARTGASSSAAGVDEAAEGVAEMVPSPKANAAQPSSPASSIAASALGSPQPAANDPAKPSGGGALQPEQGKTLSPPKQQQQRQGPREEVVESRPGGGAGGNGEEVTGIHTGAAEGGKEAPPVEKERAKVEGGLEEEAKTSPSPVGGGQSGDAGGKVSSAAAGGGAAPQGDNTEGCGKGCPPAAKKNPAAGPCLCPPDAEGGAAHKTVMVERRCWPGSNKPGGVARIVKKYTVEEEVYGETVENAYYDVKYLLGGSEKKVKETFISCTPNETEARQAAPREIFTVEAPEPTRRQRSAPARTRPLSATMDTNSSAAVPSSSSTKAKAMAKAKEKASAEREKAKRRSAPAGGDGGADGRAQKKTKKRARAAEGGDDRGGAVKRRDGGGGVKRGGSSSSRGCEENEVKAPVHNEAARHKITDLSVVSEAQKTRDAPLSSERMATLAETLHSLFRQSTHGTIPLATLQTAVNTQRSPSTAQFDACELKHALAYLEDVESKVMLDGDTIYRI